ncbi:MAG TPA: efflux RND transporter periplasmic adaptor subunit [Acidobacteriaceae bacterium]|jgi:membrane fusion protein (multidrug efflux system)|nr:efflux RND transporter periplasmic adaptor subunit [Acidobacteriaceae bacterium]
MAAGAAAILLPVLLCGCSSKPSAPPRGAMGPLPVGVVTVQQADVPLTGEWVGTLDGYVNAQIQPQVSGYLIRQDYREGSVVSKDQVLFEIDPRPFEAALQQAEGQLGQAQGQVGQAQAQLGLAQINVNRDTPLAAEHAIAQSQLDNDKQQAAQTGASVRAAQAAVATAQANIATAKLNLGFTKVRSLISGIAGQATIQVGNLVSPQSVLTSVSQLDPIKVYFSISDDEYLELTHRAEQAGGDLLHNSGNLALSLTLADGTIFPHTGRIIFVDRQMNQQTGAIRIAAEFPNPGNVLRPGQFARVKAQTQVLHNALLVPQSAVQELQGIEQVYVVGADNHIHVANVTLGPQYQNDWVITSGLQPGQQIAIDNLQKLRDGAPVSPHPAPNPSPSTAPTAAGR